MTAENSTFVAHPLHWTPEKVARFWDYCARRSHAESEYFSNQLGAGVVAFAQQVRAVSGLQVMDYGCGPGYLVPHLLAAGARVNALDHSPVSVQQANLRFQDQPGWEGGTVVGDPRSQGLAGTMDMVFCLEAIEHVPPAAQAEFLGALRSLLTPGGVLMMTTPNDEDLRKLTIMCPDCGAEFHRWQHLLSWNARTLRAHLEDAGFEVMFCQGVNLASFQSHRRIRWTDHSVRTLVNALRRLRQRVLDWLSPRAFPGGRAFQASISRQSRPNLVAIARRKTT